MFKAIIGATCAFAAASCLAADRPHWHPQATPTAAQLRDVSVVDARIAWAAGEDGVVLRTTDGGRHWQAVAVDEASGIAFRDIEAFSSRTATVLAVGEGRGSRIYRTDDAGRTWQLQYRTRADQPALACFGFWNSQQGVAIGESRNGSFQLRVTTDGGRRWQRVQKDSRPVAVAGERIIGGGQNCLAATGNGRIAFAAGDGTRARLVTSDDAGGNWKALELPQLAVVAPGAVGMLLKGGNAGFAARGVSENEVSQLTELTQSGAVDRTAMRRDGRVRWVSVGSDGSVLSDRTGDVRSAFDTNSFAAVDGSVNGALVLAVGSDGRIAQLRWAR